MTGRELLIRARCLLVAVLAGAVTAMWWSWWPLQPYVVAWAALVAGLSVWWLLPLRGRRSAAESHTGVVYPGGGVEALHELLSGGTAGQETGR